MSALAPPPSASAPAAEARLPWRLWLSLLVLAAIQFTNMVDFMIMMPLSPQFMRIFSISAQEFSRAVAVYAFAASISGIFAALYLDRYDRRQAMLLLFSGLIVATAGCGLAESYAALLAARIACGFFGGVIGATAFAAAGDLFPDSHRGRATGVLMSAFSLATVAGLPAGLWLASKFGWHAPFFTLAIGGLALLGLAAWLLPPMRAHVGARSGGGENPWAKLRRVFAPESHRRAFALTVFLTLSGMCVVPYIAAYLVGNAGVAENQIPFVYACGGACTLISMNVIGRITDRRPRLTVFTIIAAGSIFPTLLLTHLPVLPLALILTSTSLFMIMMTGRWVPAMAMLTSASDPRLRGAFMSLNSSMQTFAVGVSAYLSGFLVLTAADGSLHGYGTIGWISAVLALGSILVARRLAI